MIARTLSSFVSDNAGWFPVVTVTGPRQSGKSTLVQHVFPDYGYVNLEDEGTRNAVEREINDVRKQLNSIMGKRFGYELFKPAKFANPPDTQGEKRQKGRFEA